MKDLILNWYDSRHARNDKINGAKLKSGALIHGAISLVKGKSLEMVHSVPCVSASLWWTLASFGSSRI